MRTKSKKFVCLALACALVSLVALSLVACNGSFAGDLDMPVGSRPSGLKNLINDADREEIASAMQAGASEEAKKEAIIKLYNIANDGRIAQNNSLVIQESVMGICTAPKPTTTLEDRMLGTVLMHGYNLRTGNSWYNEFAAQSISDNKLSNAIFGAFSTMVKVNYHLEDEPDDYYFVSITDAALETNCKISRFPYMSYRLIKEPQAYYIEEFNSRMHILKAPNEICNMDFMAEIIADGATITLEDGLYKVHFSVDTEDGDDELLKQWYRKPQEDMKDGGQTIKRYLRFNCDFEVWSNGYIKSFKADYVRDAGLASSITVDNMSYIYDLDEISEILEDDYRLDGLTEIEKNLKFKTLYDRIEYYKETDVVKARLSPLYISFIVIASVAGAAIIAVIIVEILVRAGKLPKLAAKRAAKKQKRLEKKAARKALKAGIAPEAALGTEKGQDDKAMAQAESDEEADATHDEAPKGEQETTERSDAEETTERPDAEESAPEDKK